MGPGSRGRRCEGADAATATMFGWQVKIGVDPGPDADLRSLVPLRTVPGHRACRVGHLDQARCSKQAFGPMFLLWAFCMLLTASTELAPQGMQSLVLEKTAGMNGTYILIYTSSMMFVLRHFAGPIAHRLSPVGMLTGSAVLSAIGLYALSFAYDFTTRDRRGDDLWAGNRLFLADDAGRDGRTIPAGRGVSCWA